jgi:hypothetical protein
MAELMLCLSIIPHVRSFDVPLKLSPAHAGLFLRRSRHGAVETCSGAEIEVVSAAKAFSDGGTSTGLAGSSFFRPPRSLQRRALKCSV